MGWRDTMDDSSRSRLSLSKVFALGSWPGCVRQSSCSRKAIHPNLLKENNKKKVVWDQGQRWLLIEDKMPCQHVRLSSVFIVDGFSMPFEVEKTRVDRSFDCCLLPLWRLVQWLDIENRIPRPLSTEINTSLLFES